jgi:hypothetical protein
MSLLESRCTQLPLLERQLLPLVGEEEKMWHLVETGLRVQEI